MAKFSRSELELPTSPVRQAMSSSSQWSPLLMNLAASVQE
jgi:hypothetical protein